MDDIKDVTYLTAMTTINKQRKLNNDTIFGTTTTTTMLSKW